jgi:Holliday junction resolvase
MKMNSREKGKRGERAWRDELRANGYMARRGQQFCGSPDSPDVVCEALAWAHFEVKAVERLNIEDAMEQARRQAVPARNAPGGAGAKVPIVAHRRSHRRWLVTMEAETFFRLVRGDFLEGKEEGKGALPGGCEGWLRESTCEIGGRGAAQAEGGGLGEPALPGGEARDHGNGGEEQEGGQV